MKVYLAYNSFCKTVGIGRMDSIEKNGTLTLTKESIHSWLDEKECHICKVHLDIDAFWAKKQELSISLKINPSKRNSMYLKIQGNCLAELTRIFGSDIKVQISLEDEDDKILPISNEMGINIPVSSEACKRSKYDAYCENTEVDISNAMFNWISGNDTELWISIGMTGSFHRSIGDANVPNMSSVNEKILNQMIGTDITIVASDGTSIPCHKAFLMAQSPIFAAMLLNGSETNIIKTDIPSKSLKPFLDYLYFYEVSGPIEDLQIAIDLLHAGHMYDVKAMKTKMERILLGNPSAIFTPDDTIRLYRFVRNVETYQRIKIKIVKILKRFGREALTESEEFNNLFEFPTTSGAAKELLLDVMEEHS